MPSTRVLFVVQCLWISMFVKAVYPNIEEYPGDDFILPAYNHGPSAFKDPWNCNNNNSYCYFISTARRSWNDANKHCHELGGALPSGVFAGIMPNTSYWSSLRWYNGRLHMFDTWKNSIVMKDTLRGTLHYMAKQQNCFGASDNLDPQGYRCDDLLPYFCVVGAIEFDYIREKLVLPVETANDVRLERIRTIDGKDALRCSAKFRSQAGQRPSRIVWIMDHMYTKIDDRNNDELAQGGGRPTPHWIKEASGGDDGETSGSSEVSSSGDPGDEDISLEEGGSGYTTDNDETSGKLEDVLPLPYKSFTSFICEVRYLGLVNGSRSNEVQVTTPSTAKLALMISLGNHQGSSATSLSDVLQNYSQSIDKVVETVNRRTNCKLTRIGNDAYSLVNSELVWISYFLLQVNDQWSVYGFIKHCLARNVSMRNTDESLENTVNVSVPGLERLFRLALPKPEKVQLVAVDRCPAENFTEELAWIGSAGQEVAPTARQPSSACLDKAGNLVTRTCHASLTSQAKWVEPFSVDQNCSQWEEQDQIGFCPLGYERKGNGHREYCLKNVSASTWSDAMAACFGGYKRHPERNSYDYDAQHWIESTLDFIKRQEGTPKLVEDLVWLPSRRRIPGGPLYPYFVHPERIEELPTLNNWEMQLNLTSITSEVIQLDYSDLDSKELCLAWSTKKQTLLTRHCSERYPTICVKKIAHFNATLDTKPISPSIYGIKKCNGFDHLLPNELGRHSCYQLIERNFTWEEAVAECQKKHPNATLAILSPFLRTYVLRHRPMRFERTIPSHRRLASIPAQFFKPTLFETNSELWLGFRQTRPSLNNECRFVNVKNECIPTPSSVDNDTDFLYGIYGSTSQHSQSSWTLQPPQTQLGGAVCELEYNPVEKPELKYYLTLEWVANASAVRVILKYDARPTIEFKEANLISVRNNLVCFTDGKIENMNGSKLVNYSNEVSWEIDILSDIMSVHCESMSLDSIFLRSNTLSSQRSEFRFIVALRYRNVKIVKDSNYTPNCEKFMNEKSDGSRLLLNKLSYIKLFEPSLIEGSCFNQSRQLYMGIFQKMFRNYDKQMTNLSYILTHIHFDRVATDTPNEENLLVRYHIDLNNPTLWQQIVYSMLNSNFSIARDNVSVEDVRSTVVCLTEKFGNLTWTETRLQKTAFPHERCVLEGGSLVQRTCNGHAYFGAKWGPIQAWNRNGELENLTADFVCSVPSHTTDQIIDMMNNTTNATSVLAGLQNITNTWEPSLVDIQLTSRLLLNAANSDLNYSNVDVNRTASIIQQVLAIDTETLANAQKIPSVSTSLLVSLEEILTRTESGNLPLTTPSFEARVMPIQNSSSLLFGGQTTQLGDRTDSVKCTAIKSTPSIADAAHYDAAVVLNASSLPEMSRGNSSITFILHTNIRLIDAAAAERKQTVRVFHSNPSDGNTEAMHPLNCTPNSALLQVGVKGGSVKLSEPVSLYFRPFKQANASDPRVSILCAFWNPESNYGAGGWSTDGCWYLGNENGFDHCQCNHFSAFVAFYAYAEGVDLGFHEAILDFITMLGCGLSLLGLVGIIATYILFPQFRKVSSHAWGRHVTFNLSLALALLLGVFLGGFERTEYPLVCLTVAALLHYLMLATFCWMLVEAYCHYLLFVKVFNTYMRRFMWKACLFSWLTPTVPVIFNTVMKRDFYYYKRSDRHCWLTPEGFYYTLLPLVGLISVINVVLYVRILVSVLFMKSVAQANKNQSNLTMRQLNMAISTFVLLGLSWVFGLLAVGKTRILFSYLFCLFTSMQGAAMFWFFVFKERRAGELWAGLIRNISAREQARRQRVQMMQGYHKDRSGPAIPGHLTLSKATTSTSDGPKCLSEQTDYEVSKC